MLDKLPTLYQKEFQYEFVLHEAHFFFFLFHSL